MHLNNLDVLKHTYNVYTIMYLNKLKDKYLKKLKGITTKFPFNINYIILIAKLKDIIKYYFIN